MSRTTNTDLLNEIENLPAINMHDNLDDTIADMLQSGVKQRIIVELLTSGKITGGDMYSKSRAYNVIYLVKQKIKNEFERNKDYIVSDIYNKFEDLYDKAYKSGEYKECREILRDLGKYTGIGQNQVNISKPDENIVIKFGFND